MPIIKREGKYIARINYTDINGRYKTKQTICLTRQEAKDKERELLKELDIHQPVKVTMDTLIDEWLFQRKQDTKLTTMDAYNKIIKLHIRPYFNKALAERINARDIEQYKLWLTKKGFKTIYKQKILNRLKEIFQYGMKYYDLPTNPCIIAGNFKSKPNEKKLQHVITLNEWSMIDSYIDTSNELDKKVRILLNLCFYCGLRKGEANALKWKEYKDCPFGKYIEVNSTVNTKVHSGGSYYEGTPKTESSKRVVPVPLPLQTMLDEWYKDCKNFYLFSDDWYICGTFEPLAETYITKVLDKAQTGLGKHITVHDLRRSYITILMDETNAKADTVRKLVGHNDTSMIENVYYLPNIEKYFSIVNQLKNDKK